VIDGYIWLDRAGRRGLGAHLHEALGGRVAVVGVAKTAFSGAPAIPVMRGASKTPLFVSAEGMASEEAAGHITRMHGKFRIDPPEGSGPALT
jgi:deoxyribonuclease V